MAGKVAVLVGGMFREFEHAYPTWRFLKDLNFDLYISTWSHTEEKAELGLFAFEEVTKERIHAVEPRAIIEIEPMKRINTHSGPMMYHWNKLFQMLSNSDAEYETVILTRTDFTLLELEPFADFIDKIKLDRVYALSSIEFKEPPENLFLADCFFMGKFEIMMEAFSNMEYCPPNVGNIHKHMALHFLNADIHIESLGNIIKFAIMRRVSRGQPINFV